MRPVPVTLLLLATITGPAAGQGDKKSPDISIDISNDHRFGINVGGRGAAAKKLLFANNGTTNNTCARINNVEMLLHKAATRGMLAPKGVPVSLDEAGLSLSRSEWAFPPVKLKLTQDLAVIEGDSGRLDTCLVRYTFHNEGKVAQKVGLRIMLDTLIGSNDGVPFIVPEKFGLCDTVHVATKKTGLPLYIQALERPSFKSPGTVAHLALTASGKHGDMEKPSSMQLSAWLGDDVGWTIPLRPMGTDSMAALWWGEATLGAGKKRTMGFTYGLGKLAVSAESEDLALSIGGNRKVGGAVAVTAYLSRATAGKTVSITVPEGLKLADGQKTKHKVALKATDKFTQVSWRLQAMKEGDHEIEVALSDGTKQRQKVIIDE